MDSGIFRRMKISGREKNREDPSHRRLRRRLEGWAESLGFSRRDTHRSWGIRPDIVRADDSGKFMFFGDAAMADHERPDAPGVKERIAACTSAFANLVRLEEIHGGRIAVATDSEKVATRWAQTLGAMLAEEGLVTENGETPDFTVKKLSPKTWVVYW